jgi:hypothetical protein
MEMQYFVTVTGLPHNETIHNIDLDNPRVYGFSWIMPEDKRWHSRIGSFDYLYKKFIALVDEDDEFEDEDRKFQFSHVFFILNDKRKPVEIIDLVRLSPEHNFRMTGEKSDTPIVLRDLSDVDEDAPHLVFRV